MAISKFATSISGKVNNVLNNVVGTTTALPFSRKVVSRSFTSKAISRSPRVLSIQSHVVSGYCGNKSATFPMQLLECEVDVINTVQLSNHTQYPVARGQIFTSQDLDKLYTGLKENNLLKLYDFIVSGYVADVSYVKSMAKLIADTKNERKQVNEDCFYAIDPVLGDDGVGHYVPEGPKMAEAYKEHLLPLADMMTPNRFEASFLSGVEIDQDSKTCLQQALNATNLLHKQTGVQIIVLTSLKLNQAKNEITCLISHWPGVSERRQFGMSRYQGGHTDGSIWSITVPRLDCPFTGTGDLFTALLSTWLQKTRFDFKQSLENSINTIRDILEDTLSWHQQIGDNSVQSHELRLVQNRDKILKPSERIEAIPIRVDREISSLSATRISSSSYRSSDRLPITN
jgi:pyridoxine kinase